MKETVVTLVAILSIAVLASLALYHGIDGTVLSASFTVIGGLGGYSVGKLRGKHKP